MADPREEKIEALLDSLDEEQRECIRVTFNTVLPIVRQLYSVLTSVLDEEQKALLKEIISVP